MAEVLLLSIESYQLNLAVIAIDLAARKETFGRMVALKGNEIKNVRIADAIAHQKLVSR